MMSVVNAKPVTSAKVRKATAGKASEQESPSKRRVGLSRDKILVVATELFAERGFAGVSIRDIAGACGIGIPSIYHFFGDKDSLYVKCCEKEFDQVEAELSESYTLADTTPARIRGVTVRLCDILLHKREFRRLLQMGLLQDDDRGIEKITAKNFLSAFRLLAQGIRDLGGVMDADERAVLIFSLVFGKIELHRVTEIAGGDVHGKKPEKLAEYVLNIALPGHDWSS